MKRTDFIEEHTEDYNNALQDAIKQAKACQYFTIDDLSQGWRIAKPYNKDKNIAEMDANELATLYTQLESMVRDLQAFANHISEMATAKNELESVDFYEFD